MVPEVKIWLTDIQQAIEEINSFCRDIRSFQDFQRDIKTRRAVERNIEIIGEAMSRILKVEPAIQISDTRKIVDTRNRIIHGYDAVSAEVLYSILVRNLPQLNLEIKSLLN